MTPPCSVHRPRPVGVAVCLAGRYSFIIQRGRAHVFSCCVVWYTIYRHHHTTTTRVKLLRRRNQHVPVHDKALRHCHFTGHLQGTLSLPLPYSLPPFDARRGDWPPSRCITARRVNLASAKQPTRVVKSLLLQQLDGAMRALVLHARTSTARRHRECAQVLDTLLQPAPRRRRPRCSRGALALFGRQASSFLPRSRAFD
jgi:hypothetical protein